MPTHLLTVRPDDVRNGYFFLDRRLSEVHDSPALGHLGTGSRLEFIRPDGWRTQTKVLAVRSDDLEKGGRDDEGTLYWIGNNPVIRVRLSPLLTDQDAPPGTEVWLLDDVPPA
jgi:hypothetical protein